MRTIQAIVFIANILLLFVMDVFLWTVSWCWGLGGLIGIVGFFIGYSISAGMTLAPRDYWRNSSYAIFKKKTRLWQFYCGKYGGDSIIHPNGIG